MYHLQIYTPNHITLMSPTKPFSRKPTLHIAQLMPRGEANQCCSGRRTAVAGDITAMVDLGEKHQPTIHHVDVDGWILGWQPMILSFPTAWIVDVAVRQLVMFGLWAGEQSCAMLFFVLSYLYGHVIHRCVVPYYDDHWRLICHFAELSTNVPSQVDHWDTNKDWELWRWTTLEGGLSKDKGLSCSEPSTSQVLRNQPRTEPGHNWWTLQTIRWFIR